MILALGLLVIIFLGTKALFSKWSLSPIPGYLMLGWVINEIGLFPEGEGEMLSFLANTGIVLLLFHIGLETHVARLLRVAKTAAPLAVVEMAVTTLTALAAGWLFGLSMATNASIAIALSATSMGVSAASWKERDLRETKAGSILLDLAIIDDIFSILLMVLLFSVLAGQNAPMNAALTIGGIILLVALSSLFSHYIEPYLMKRLVKYEKMPDSMLTIVGIALIIASVSLYAGLSIAIGAFFAGIAFSRDPNAVRMDTSMRPLLDLFVPFFFFWIGYQIHLTHLLELWPLLLALLPITLCAKLIGTLVPARALGIGKGDSWLIATSMMPRAEVTLIIIAGAARLGVISPPVYSVLSVTALVSCLITPISYKIVKRKTQKQTHADSVG